mgnify:CR=1 FL=1
MPTCSGNLYLLDESSKPKSFPIKPQLTLAEIMAKFESLTQTVTKLQAERKTSEIEDTPPRNHHCELC